MTVTAYQLSLNGAVWIDSNSRFTIDTLPDRLPDDFAIINALGNLLNCPIGARGKIFQPEYGSEWQFYLQEPIDAITSGKMFIAMVQVIARWEPRITLDYSKTFVTPDTTIPGYIVQISGTNNITKAPFTVNFTEQL